MTARRIALAMTTVVVGLVASVAMLSFGTATVDAQSAGGTLGRGGQRPFVSITVNPDEATPISPGRSFPASGAPCRYFTLDGVGNLPYLIPGLLYEARCQAWRGQPAFTRIGEAVPPADGALPPPLDRVRRDLLLDAEPPSTSPADRAVVGTPTWFWLSEPATTRSASVELGGFTASVFARPKLLLIKPGDGSTVACAVDAPEPGSASTPALETSSDSPTAEAGASEACTHRFEVASVFADAAPRPRYQVTWEVSWSTNRVRPDGSSPSGTLPDAQVIGPFDLEVVELQAVNRAE